MARRRRGQFPQPKREDGQWKIRYWTDEAQEDGTRQRVRKTKCLGSAKTTTFREARKAVSRFLEPINEVRETAEQSGKTMRHLISKWREAIKPTLRPSTGMGYEWAFKRISPAFGAAPLAAIGKSDVQCFLTDATRSLAPKSVRELRGYLRGMLTLATEWDWIARNPAAGKLKLPTGQVREKVILTPEQFWKLARELEPPHRTLAVLAVLSGLRRGELAALRHEDFTGDAIMVDESVYRGHLGDPKTAKSRRRVAIGPLAQAALREWILRSRFRGPKDFLFAVRRNVPIDLHHVVARHIKPACRRAGIPVCSWHDFRHTYTTWSRRAGVPAEIVRDQLGHTSVAITMDIYSHVDDRASGAASVESYARGAIGTLTGTPAGNEYRLTA